VGEGFDEGILGVSPGKEKGFLEKKGVEKMAAADSEILYKRVGAADAGPRFTQPCSAREPRIKGRLERDGGDEKERAAGCRRSHPGFTKETVRESS